MEHGLGHFISAVERGSEAHLQGLRPGDQILAVDGMMLTGATHREVVTLISSRWTLEISVKSTGVIPIKDRVGDPITWHSIALRPEPPMNEVIKHLHTIPIESHVESRVVISITGSQGLGCSICKGPSSKPGIYIQSTKPGGLARQVGLRPGDQILDCNGISFQRLEFNEAVYHLKSSRHLDLLIRKGAGADLFPSESSGYDSSSSSSMGDSRPNNPYRASVVIDTAKLSKSASDLSMSTKPADVFTNRLRLEERVIEEERKKLEEEQERLKREAMRLEAEKKRFEEEKKLTTTNKAKSKSSPDLNDSIGSSIESSISGGLASQIQNELQRRAQKTVIPTTQASSVVSVPLPPPPPKVQPQSNTNTMQKKAIQKEKTLANLKNDKHDALMEEFKRAHRRMFNSSTEEDEEDHQQHLRVIEDMNQMKEDTEYETQAIVTSVAVDLMPKPQETKSVVKKEISFAPEPKSMADVVSIQSTSTITTTASKSYCSDDTLSGSCSCSNTMSSSSNPSNSSSCEESETTLSYIESEKPAKSTTPPFPPERSSSISPETANPPPKTSSMLKKKKVPLSSFKPPLARKGQHNSPGIPTPDYDSTPERSPKSFKKRRYQNSSLSRYRSNSMSSLLEPAPPTAPSLRETTLRRLAPRLSPARSVPDLVERPSSRSGSTSGRTNTSNSRTCPKHNQDIGEIGSLDSFSINDNIPRGDPKPPAHYFECQANKNTNTLVTMRSYLPERPEQIRFEFLPQPSQNKSVRFNVGEEAMIAAQDYRVANASRKPHMKTLEQRQLMTKVSPRTRASPRSSPSPSSSQLTVSSDEEPTRFQRNGPLRKSKGPLLMMSSTTTRGNESMKKKPQAPPPPGEANQMKKQELKI